MPANILVVEDDEDILFIIELVLKEAGFEVFTSVDGGGVEETITNLHPDLVLMDIQLPKADGRDLCKSIKKDQPGLPVILMSANVEYSRDAQISCANGFISKPFELDFLLSQIQNYIQPAQ